MDLVLEKQTGTLKNCLPWRKLQQIYQVYKFPFMVIFLLWSIYAIVTYAEGFIKVYGLPTGQVLDQVQSTNLDGALSLGFYCL